MLECIEKEVPRGDNEWAKVVAAHNAFNLRHGYVPRDIESLKRKFYRLAGSRSRLGTRLFLRW